MENQKQQKSEQQIPDSAYNLARDHQLGQPLALYSEPLPWLCFYFYVPRVLMIVAICIFVVRLFLVIFGFFHLQALQPQDSLIQSLFAMFLSLGVIILLGVVAKIMPRTIPKYWLACSGGLMCVFFKKVEVTRWDEVTDLVKTLRRHYRLIRTERESLSFGYPLERFEELADLVRQHIPDA